MSVQTLFIKKGVYYLSEYKANEFENLYLKVRKKENRIYDDKLLRMLPDIKNSHPLVNEWKIRKNSLQKIGTYLKSKSKNLNIMELGCGNGWLTHHLAMIKKSYVIGVDINKHELEQAARVFNNFNNHKFFYADIFADYFELGDFDIIILASSLQYFMDINNLMERLFYLIKREGEIHILDSPIYDPSEILVAQKRTKKYYEKLDCPEMSKYYYHHTIDKLKRYKPVFLYSQKKQSFYSRLFKTIDSPFPWIMIKN
jgi:ubiquinone/menaquinone biosynthesis C-methylase UbiE